MEVRHLTISPAIDLDGPPLTQWCPLDALEVTLAWRSDDRDRDCTLGIDEATWGGDVHAVAVAVPDWAPG